MDSFAAYKLWLGRATEDPDLQAELRSIEGNEGEISDRFYRDLAFGTGGLRGVIGAGSNRIQHDERRMWAGFLQLAQLGAYGFPQLRKVALPQVAMTGDAYDNRNRHAIQGDTPFDGDTLQSS